jgi:hypothetical protein
MSFRLIPAIAFALVTTGSVVASEPSEAVMTAWFKMNHATIHVGDALSETQEFKYDIAPNGDLQVQIFGPAGGKKSIGTLMIVSGVLLAKDVPLTRGEEIDAIDEPALILQLTNKLLAAAVRREPDQVHGDSTIDLDEKSWEIDVSTMSAEGVYPAPWKLRGKIESSTANVIKYEFTHTFSVEREKHDVHYVGSWEHSSVPVKFDDTMSLKGWQIFNLGPIKSNKGTSTILDYGASNSTSSYKTLGDLRKAATQEQK